MAPAMGMSETSIEEYTKKMRARYGRLTGRKALGRLLDEFIEITGWERKHANKVLLGKRRSKGRGGKRGAPRKYGTELCLGSFVWSQVLDFNIFRAKITR